VGARGKGEGCTDGTRETGEEGDGVAGSEVVVVGGFLVGFGVGGGVVGSEAS
jgi:hypothetical protein